MVQIRVSSSHSRTWTQSRVTLAANVDAKSTFDGNSIVLKLYYSTRKVLWESSQPAAHFLSKTLKHPAKMCPFVLNPNLNATSMKEWTRNRSDPLRAKAGSWLRQVFPHAYSPETAHTNPIQSPYQPDKSVFKPSAICPIDSHL